MDFINFTAGKDDENRRLDKVTRRFLPDSQLSSIYKYIRKALIKVNGKKSSPETHIIQGDVISLASFILSDKTPEKSSQLQKIDNELSFDIILENDDFFIINKPYGIQVHGTDDSLDVQVRAFLKNHAVSKENEGVSDKAFTKEMSLSFTPGPLHRLDKNTTGILVFSKSLKGAREFSKILQEHKIQKIYTGIIQGNLGEKQDWNDSITNERKTTNKFYTVKATAGINSKSQDSKNNSKTAVTTVTPLAHGKYNGMEITLAEFFIKTGRKHQIRSQSALHGFPLLGDTAYGGKCITEKNGKLKKEFFLHATELIFEDDFSSDFGMPKTICCPVPEDFKDLFS